MKIPKNLVDLIAELKTPKARQNSFAKFSYRNVEDITQAAKPLLQKYKLCLNLTDDIVVIDSRLFVKASAIISDGDTTMTSTGFAEMDSARKGMSLEQISGSASSYARKYALAGLLCLDASEDSDSHQEKHQRQTLTRTQVNQISRLLKETNSDKDKFLSWLGVTAIKDIPIVDFARAKKALESKINTEISPI